MINILVTGAGRGIGRAIVKEIVEHYSNRNIRAGIAICSRTAAELEETSRLSNELVSIYPYVCDFGDLSAIEGLVNDIHRDLGSIDILINNAGMSYVGLLQDMSVADISHLMTVNLTSAMVLSSLLIPDLLKSQSARIINISSVWGQAGASCEVVYSASKGGMNAYTKALAKELAPSKIPVNAIACGYIDTEMNSHLSPEEKEELFSEIPMGRPGSPKEIGQSVCLLLEATDYMTGQIITIDGGWI